MCPAPAPTVSRIEHDDRSRQLISGSRVLIAHARELIRQSQWRISEQTYLTIVCAWCQQTMRWQRSAGAARGQISHSICYDCFAPVFGELHAVTAPPPCPKQIT